MAIRPPAALAALLTVVTLLAACGGSGREPVASPAATDALGDDAITVASFDFPESELLAELYGGALRDAGFEVRVESGLGPRELVAPAMAAGLVELVPEYLGTALRFLSLGEAPTDLDTPAAAHDLLVETLARTDVEALEWAPAEDTNVFVVTRRTATQHRLRELSDLAPVAETLTFGGPPECPARALCLGGLRQEYGLRFRAFLPVDAGGPVTRQALDAGQIDVALLFSTDPAIDGLRLVALEDDKDLQPPENVTPLVRKEVLERWGDDLKRVVNGVSADLTTEDLKRLNRQVQREDERGTARVADIAARWLAERGDGGDA